MASAANPMQEIRIEKVTLNISVGEAGDELEKAERLLDSLTDQKVCRTKASKTNTFGLSEGRPMGVKVTLRGEEAEEFLERVLEVKDNRIPAGSFDTTGNFSLGISEHIDLPGVTYSPDIGIFGMDVSVTLERPGFRVKRRSVPSEVGETHQITKREGREFMEKEFGVTIGD